MSFSCNLHRLSLFSLSISYFFLIFVVNLAGVWSRHHPLYATHHTKIYSHLNYVFFFFFFTQSSPWAPNWPPQLWTQSSSSVGGWKEKEKGRWESCFLGNQWRYSSSPSRPSLSTGGNMTVEPSPLSKDQDGRLDSWEGQLNEDSVTSFIHLLLRSFYSITISTNSHSTPSKWSHCNLLLLVVLFMCPMSWEPHVSSQQHQYHC